MQVSILYSATSMQQEETAAMDDAVAENNRPDESPSNVAAADVPSGETNFSIFSAVAGGVSQTGASDDDDVYRVCPEKLEDPFYGSPVAAWCMHHVHKRAMRTACACCVTELLSICSSRDRLGTIKSGLLHRRLNPQRKSSRSLKLMILSEYQFRWLTEPRLATEIFGDLSVR